MQNSPHSDISLGLRVRILRTLLAAELAAGIYGLKLFITCVAIATVMMGAVWMMGDSLTRSLSDSGTTLLGGDVAVTVVNVPLDDALVEGLSDLGSLSRVAELRSSAVVGTTRLSVEVKGVDDSYPLNGTVKLASGRDLNTALKPDAGRAAVVVEPSLLRRLDADIGDTVRLGSLEFVISDTLIIEPDRLSAGRFMVGPRILVRLDTLMTSGLIQRGSIVDFRYRT